MGKCIQDSIKSLEINQLKNLIFPIHANHPKAQEKFQKDFLLLFHLVKKIR